MIFGQGFLFYSNLQEHSNSMERNTPTLIGCIVLLGIMKGQ